MAKAKAAIKEAPTKAEIEFNQWCVDRAMQWPMVHIPASGSGQAGLGQLYQQYQPARDVEVDILVRAKKISDWVKTNR